MNLPRFGVFLIGVVLLCHAGSLDGGKGKDDDVVTAETITKSYTAGAGEFDKMYKGKTVTVEGVVATVGAKGDERTFLMLDGYKKPGDAVAHSVRCEESGPDFEGIRTGHKVRIRGVVQPFKDTVLAVELREAKVVKVFADDYPPSKAARAEVKKLQGKWIIVGAEAVGQKLPAKQAGFDAITFEGYQAYLHQGTKLLAFGLVVDPEKAPKLMNLVGGVRWLPCIYTLEKDQLTVTLPGQDAKGEFIRPNGQDTSKHTGLLLRAEREKSK